MSPLAINPLAVLGGAVLALSIGFSGGWMVQGWRKDSALSEQKAESAEAVAKSANDALSQLESRIATMNKSSTEARADVTGATAKLSQITKELKNAQANRPLPAGCRPDDVRVQSLREAIGSANAAIKGAAAR